MKKNYRNYIFFSAGPVGDHLVQIDFANRLFRETGRPSLLIMKHPNAFTKDLAIPYRDHIDYLEFVGSKGFLKMVSLMIKSIVIPNCYVLIFPIPPPRYLIWFSYYIRFCTRSRIIGFNVEGTKSFPQGKGYVRFLGSKNIIPMVPEMFFESCDRLLAFLGHKPYLKMPRLKYVFSEEAFSKIGVIPREYMVFHLNASHFLRTLPEDRWNRIIEAVQKASPDLTLVFTGTKKDKEFIEACLGDLPRDRVLFDFGVTDTQEALTLYANAKVVVTVNTGVGLIVNMLHIPTVMVAVNGTAMFYYHFNDKAKILFSKKDCRCNPLEMECNMVPYKGREYMACLFNINDDDIISAIKEKL